MLRGSHGTCRSFAESIVKSSRFKVSDVGRLGCRIYFWKITNDDAGTLSGRQRAKDWHWVAKNKLRSYEHASDKRCAVLFVQIEESNVLKLDDDNVLNSFSKFFEVAIKKYEANRCKVDDRVRSNMYDEFVRMLVDAGGAIDIVTGPIQLARRDGYSLVNVLSCWPGIVVRKNELIREIVEDK